MVAHDEDNEFVSSFHVLASPGPPGIVPGSVGAQDRAEPTTTETMNEHTPSPTRPVPAPDRLLVVRPHRTHDDASDSHLDRGPYDNDDTGNDDDDDCSSDHDYYAFPFAVPPCCRTNIIRETGNRALFNPALNSCPAQANFICSVMVDLQILPNTIIINGGTVIANGPMGENSFAVLVCNPQKVS
ncbi:hypothetical protein PRIPAC_93213 [Pristionchus pacificus]|uniref:Uncharacterized protein n=1 Tax=Pristionchus pacificus TaxID=54126 RepID=A0A2A6BRG3_PRIPA|nr:hypothetical protein PRIPAC_93213 [Pristionchus pacificus]|eukprot:PDM68383.1 hypothetical protein PRIPAC_46427 [Pristionchus pacificus]